MISLFDDTGARLTVTYNGLSLNVDSDSPDETYALDTVTVVPQYNTNIDQNPNADGSLLGPVHRTLLLVRIDGVVRAPTLAKYAERVKNLVAAFDPAEVYAANESSDGAIALDFTTLTTDTTNYATGKVGSRYYARCRGLYVPVSSAFTGSAGFFTAELVVPNPVRLAQALDTLTGAGSADTRAGNTKTWPTLTITMAGAGSATYAITVGSSSLTLDLSGRANGEVVVVDMENKSIKVDGAETQSLYVSGDWFSLPDANNTVAYANTTNATSVLSWRRAWVI